MRRDLRGKTLDMTYIQRQGADNRRKGRCAPLRLQIL